MALTDNEIVKAKSMLKKLEEAYEAYYDTSKGMPYDIDVTLRETAICLENSLNEINRQKAEIERLTAEANRYKRYYFNHEYDEMERTAKAEAIKEFAERLKLYSRIDVICPIKIISMPEIALDNLVKEMVGDV